jgi:8-oxo-dGTP pyrophosphatase MutT (NUDIX family)
MIGIKPRRASAFAAIMRPDGCLYCTVEGDAAQLGLPGGKWDPETDTDRWDDIVAREFAEEIGVELPAATGKGYLEWGNAHHQIRIVTMRVTAEAAAALPLNTALTSDPDGAVRATQWVRPKTLLSMPRSVRKHIYNAVKMMSAMGPFQRELYHRERPAGAAVQDDASEEDESIVFAPE